MLTCTPEAPRNFTALIVGCVAMALVVLAAALVFAMYVSMRPRWLRERKMQAKRTRGAPKALKPGEKVTVSIAVTDIKNYSDLTRRHPELMKHAMASHNNILRKACHMHAGYVICQEGDSWTVAFHEAEDAVAFGLQVGTAPTSNGWRQLTCKAQLSPTMHRQCNSNNSAQDCIKAAWKAGLHWHYLYGLDHGRRSILCKLCSLILHCTSPVLLQLRQENSIRPAGAPSPCSVLAVHCVYRWSKPWLTRCGAKSVIHWQSTTLLATSRKTACRQQEALTWSAASTGQAAAHQAAEWQVQLAAA